jgi:hypothetical protein
MTTPYIDSFLFQGRPPGSPVPAAWSVTLGVVTADPFGGDDQVSTKGPLTATEAEALGFDLTTVLAGLNAQGLIAAERAAADAEQATAQIGALQAALAEAETRCAQALAELVDLRAHSRRQAADLEASRAAARAGGGAA